MASRAVNRGLDDEQRDSERVAHPLSLGFG